VVDTVYATLPHLLASKGRLGIVSSVLGKLSRPKMSAYVASKFALCGFAETIAYELAPDGVSVTSLNPGRVASNFLRVDNQNRVREDWKSGNSGRMVVPADRAAREIADALYRRKIDATITGHGRFGVFMYRHFPAVVRFGIRRGAAD
jgi:short-subunit dehydrogenase